MAGAGAEPSGLQRKPFSRRLPLGTTTVSGTVDSRDWPIAWADSSPTHAKRNPILMVTNDTKLTPCNDYRFCGSRREVDIRLAASAIVVASCCFAKQTLLAR